MLKATHYSGDGKVISVYKNVFTYLTGVASEITLLIDNDKTRRMRKKYESGKGMIVPEVEYSKYTSITIFGNVVVEKDN